jgi:dCTP deaminase
MIKPFVPELIRYNQGSELISFGLSSFGYDIRLSSNDFRIFRHIPGEVADPKRFNESHLEQAVLHSDNSGDYFIIPGNSYALGCAMEALDVPRNIMVVCVGKSTYARVGLICNCTPAEPGWKGHLTLEFSNSSSADCRIYANEGVAQLLFFEGGDCDISYADRNGKYQYQLEEVTLPRSQISCCSMNYYQIRKFFSQW